MNKRHYEHTLPNIRGSLSNTYVYFMSESLVCYVAKFVFIMKKSAYENKIFR